MEAGRNFENPSRLGLLFLSNSFIAHPFSHVCAARPRALASCSKYRRLEKRKSRLAAYLPSVESLNLQDFFPSWAAPGPVRMFVRLLSALGSKFRTALPARQVFDTLVAYRAGTPDVEPALATRWSVSRDGLTWSFTLRDGVRFHDGTPLTAAEVAGSFTRQFRPEGAGTAVVWPALFR